MRIDSNLFLKWIQPSATSLEPEGQNFCKICAVVAHDRGGKCQGFTLFEPKDFNEALYSRLQMRINREASANLSFTLLLPEFLRHRFETLLKHAGGKPVSAEFTSFFHIGVDGEFRTRLRVVSVDDSPVILKLLKHMMESIGGVDIVAQISDSRLAAQKILELRPDVITLDIQMPGKNGVQVVTELMASCSIPVLMISSLSLEEGSLVIDALNAGAFDYIQKPGVEDRSRFQEELEAKMFSAVENRKSRESQQKVSGPRARGIQEFAFSSNLIWCLGASTGGTQALTRVFTSLPHRIPPILVVQHIPPVFSKSFADSLNKLCPFTVKEAEMGEAIKDNHVYIAPGGLQMGVVMKQGKLSIDLQDSAPVNRFKPSVDYLFQCVAEISSFQIVAGILTGMGKDGAKGLLALRKAGARTVVQDEESSAVYGMPRAAFEIGAAELVAPLDDFATSLQRLSQRSVRIAS